MLKAILTLTTILTLSSCDSFELEIEEGRDTYIQTENGTVCYTRIGNVIVKCIALNDTLN